MADTRSGRSSSLTLVSYLAGGVRVTPTFGNRRLPCSSMRPRLGSTGFSSAHSCSAQARRRSFASAMVFNRGVIRSHGQVRMSARRARNALPAWTRSLDAHITASSTKSIGSTIGGWSRTPKSGDLGPKRRAMTLMASSCVHGWADGAPRLKLFGCAGFGELARVAVDVDHRCRGSQCFCGGVELGAQRCRGSRRPRPGTTL